MSTSAPAKRGCRGPGVRRVQILDVLGHAFLVQPIGDSDGFRMVGDGDISVAQRFGGRGHFLDGVFSVAGGSVHLQVALHVRAFDEMRKLVPFGGFNFAAAFAQLRFDVVELQFVVDFFFGTSGNALFPFQVAS